jgi:hypothetical protein
MARLVVAAGGGGDAVAAVALDEALHGERDEGGAVIFTYAWDRAVRDGVPGPKGAGDFVGLLPMTPGVFTVPGGARAVPPARSTVPRLAVELPYTFALIEPRHGVEGVTRQLEELVRDVQPDSVDLLDVGGDILARGDEPGLRSPLGDALTLAACCQVNADVRLLVAGAGLDGEVSAEDLRDALGPVVHTLTAEDVEPVEGVLEWHPSEAAAMLAAVARGVRGVCEAGDDGVAVPLTDDGARVHEVDLEEALRRNQLARAIMTTASLDEVEAYSRAVCGASEIDHERGELPVAGIGVDPGSDPGLDPGGVLGRVAAFGTAARERGVTHVTFRRLCAALGLVVADQRDALRRLLIDSWPERYGDAAPLWGVGPSAAGRS